MTEKEKVLIVDDDADVLFALKAVLEDAGIPVITVRSGEQCLEEITKGFRGLILMDIMMPGMDGWQTIREIVRKGYPEKTVICMLTAKHVPDSDMDELKEYVLDYIRKPFTNEEFLSTVRNYLTYTA